MRGSAVSEPLLAHAENFIEKLRRKSSVEGPTRGSVCRSIFSVYFLIYIFGMLVMITEKKGNKSKVDTSIDTVPGIFLVPVTLQQ